jgi:hypothetical protein
MMRTLELAIKKVSGLPEAAQEQLGRELLERVDTLEQLRVKVQEGIAELDSGLGEELDVEALIREIHSDHGGRS